MDVSTEAISSSPKQLKQAGGKKKKKDSPAKRSSEKKNVAWVLAVSGGRLGLTLNFVDEKTGAVVQEIDPTCTFRDKIAIGDRIISIDGKKISTASALKIGDDRERILGIVSETAEDQKPDGILLQQKPASVVKHNNSLDDKRNDNAAGGEKPAAELTKAHANEEQPASAVRLVKERIIKQMGRCQSHPKQTNQQSGRGGVMSALKKNLMIMIRRLHTRSHARRRKSQLTK